MKISSRLGGALLLAAWFLLPIEAAAVTLGQIDTFQDGTTQNWIIGFALPDLPVPVNVPTGGPAGDGDAYLLLTAVGSASPTVASRLAVFNEDQWLGNYLAAGVNAFTMSVNNLGTTNLYLRLVLANFPEEGFPADQLAMSTLPVFLPAGSGWTSVVFPLAPNHLTAMVGDVQTALTNPGELRIIHSQTLRWPPPRVVASLGVDNIKATNSTGSVSSFLLLLD